APFAQRYGDRLSRDGVVELERSGRTDGRRPGGRHRSSCQSVLFLEFGGGQSGAAATDNEKPAIGTEHRDRHGIWQLERHADRPARGDVPELTLPETFGKESGALRAEQRTFDPVPELRPGQINAILAPWTDLLFLRGIYQSNVAIVSTEY